MSNKERLLTLSVIEKMVGQSLEDYGVDDQSKLIRYLDLPKFLSLIEKKEIYLTRADRFEDLFEGEAPIFNINQNIKMVEGMYYLTNRDNSNQIPESFYDTVKNDFIEKANSIKEIAFISCWNEMNSESYALWQIYGKKYGLAIQTSAKKLKKLLEQEQGQLYKVQYIEDESQLVVPRYIEKGRPIVTDNFFVLKKSYYQYENEVRAIVFDNQNDSVTLKINNLSNFIEKVYISPFADEWYYTLIKDILKNRYNLDVEIVTSNIKIKR